MASFKEKIARTVGGLAVVGLASAAGGYYAVREGALPPFVAAQTGPNPTPQPTPSPDARVGQALQQAAEAQAKVAELKTQLETLLKVRAVPEVQLTQKGDIRVYGVPDRPNNTVDTAKGPFRNTLGMGTEGFLAEPGGLLVGPDFESRFNNNPWGNNPRGWAAMWESKGHIKPFSAVSQEVLRADAVHDQNLPEGGFTTASLGQGVVDVVDGAGNVIARFDLPHLGADHNYKLLVRGRYPEAQLRQNTQRNLNLRFYPQSMVANGFVPGHTEVEMYEAGDDTNTGFISEGQFLQQAQTSAKGATNCGAGGCSRTTAVLFDVNTGAFVMVRRTADRNTPSNQGWVGLDKNF